MIKDKLHTLTDEEAIEVALILLKGPGRSDIYLYKDEKVTRVKYAFQDGYNGETFSLFTGTSWLVGIKKENCSFELIN